MSEIGGMIHIATKYFVPYEVLCGEEISNLSMYKWLPTSLKYCLETCNVSTRESVLGQGRQKVTTITHSWIYFKVVLGENGKRNDAETNKAQGNWWT